MSIEQLAPKREETTADEAAGAADGVGRDCLPAVRVSRVVVLDGVGEQVKDDVQHVLRELGHVEAERRGEKRKMRQEGRKRNHSKRLSLTFSQAQLQSNEKENQHTIYIKG